MRPSLSPQPCGLFSSPPFWFSQSTPRIQHAQRTANHSTFCGCSAMRRPPRRSTSFPERRARSARGTSGRKYGGAGQTSRPCVPSFHHPHHPRRTANQPPPQTLLSQLTHTITSTLYKSYLLLLLIIHTPLYGFLGIDVLSSLTLPVGPPHRLPGGDTLRLARLLQRATEAPEGACDDAWTVRGLVALVSPPAPPGNNRSWSRSYRPTGWNRISPSPNGPSRYVLLHPSPRGGRAR